MKGWVYVLSNESMPGLVKIGCTTRSVEARAIELWQTGVPTPFRVVASVLSPDCQALEADIHTLLAGKRVHPSREFFEMEAQQAAGACQSMLEDQLWSLVNEFLPGHSIVPENHVMDEGTFGYLADQAGVKISTLFMALGELEPDEVRPAIARVEAQARRHIAIVSTDGRQNV